MTMNPSILTWLSWWYDADEVIRSVFVLLILASVVSWSIIFFKSWQFTSLHRQEKKCHTLLVASNKSLKKIGEAIPQGIPSALLLRRAAFTDHVAGPLDPVHSHEEMVHACNIQRIQLENGLAFLASIGSSSPFIGLLGTVWGIMHALQGLGEQKALSMDMVAGPVAEALTATAVGLFAAIPAVMGYNMLIRHLRRLMGTVEGNFFIIHNRMAQPGNRTPSQEK